MTLEELVDKLRSGEAYWSAYAKDDRVYIPGVGRIFLLKNGRAVFVHDGYEYDPDIMFEQDRIAVHKLRFCKHKEDRSPLYVLDKSATKLLCPQCMADKGIELGDLGELVYDLVYTDVHDVVVDGNSLRSLISEKMGIELEVVFPDERPFTPNPYHSRLPLRYPWPGLWRGEYDRSIDDYNGIEFISPPFTSTKYMLGSIVAMSERLRERGGKGSRHAGIHVHISDEFQRKVIYAITTSLEEFLFAVGGSWYRYTRGRYAPPLKKPYAHEGHYISLNQTRRTFEFRIFRSATDLLGILIPIALAQGVAALSKKEAVPPLEISGKDKVKEVLAKQWEVWTEYLDWIKGGEWIGWPYDPNGNHVVKAKLGRRTFEKVLPNADAILERMSSRIDKFLDKAEDMTIKEALGL